MVTGFVPGVMERLGLGYEVCSAVNPRLVYATASAFGVEGPDAGRKGVDLIGQAVGGLMRTTGQDGEFPTPVGAVIADSAGGMALTIGILAALFHREKTGRGQRIDSSLLDGQIWQQASEISFELIAGRNSERANRGHPRIAGVYRVFETRDGHLVIAGVTDREREGFFRAIDRPDLAADPRFSSAAGLAANLKELLALVEPIFRERTTPEWVERLGPENQRFAPVNDYRAVAAYEQAYAAGYLRRVDHPEWGPMSIVGNPIALSETPAEPAVTAPELGQHTEEVLLEAGYTWDEVTTLCERGAI
jgi:crotonobetainyl-CoA:carnitine CoA-transferase CaiB-like acyl-CoA transferase